MPDSAVRGPLPATSKNNATGCTNFRQGGQNFCERKRLIAKHEVLIACAVKALHSADSLRPATPQRPLKHGTVFVVTMANNEQEVP